MATIYRIQREEKYSDGKKYWNTIKSSRSKEKAIDMAKNMSGHTRVIAEEDDD